MTDLQTKPSYTPDAYGKPGKPTGKATSVRDLTEFGVESVEPDLRDWPDRPLVAAIIGHDREAFAELYRRHARSVGVAARMILGRRPTCDDIVSEVFIAFWLSPEKFDPDRGSLVGFLRMSARSRSIDVVRSMANRKLREQREVGRGRVPLLDTESTMLASDASALLRRAIALLPATEREPIFLAYFSGMTYRAVAFELGIPEGTVKSRIRSGLRSLRMNEEVQRHRLSEETLASAALGLRCTA